MKEQGKKEGTLGSSWYNYTVFYKINIWANLGKIYSEGKGLEIEFLVRTELYPPKSALEW